MRPPFADSDDLRWELPSQLVYYLPLQPITQQLDQTYTISLHEHQQEGFAFSQTLDNEKAGMGPRGLRPFLTKNPKSRFRTGPRGDKAGKKSARRCAFVRA